MENLIPEIWGVGVTVGLVLHARIAFLQDAKFREMAERVKACEVLDRDHTSALRDHREDIARNYPDTTQMNAALDAFAKAQSAQLEQILLIVKEIASRMTGLEQREREDLLRRAGDKKP